MVYDGGVDKGFVEFEDIVFDVGNADNRKAVVDPFKVALELINLHTIDKRMYFVIESLYVILANLERLLSHFLVDVPYFALFNGLFVCEG
jgi:hypothetical protein